MTSPAAPTHTPALALLATLGVAATLAALATTPATPPAQTAAPEPQPELQPEPATCTVELRSWIVMGRGRHLFIDIDCPAPFNHLDGRVEYTTATFRQDYDPALDTTAAPRLTRYDRDRRLFPPFAAPDNRLEAEYSVTTDQAHCLQLDRTFTTPYQLVGSNSNAGLRATLEDCGLQLPESLTTNEAGLPFADFPGINTPAGEQLPPEQWPDAGLPAGPTPIPTPTTDTP